MNGQELMLSIANDTMWLIVFCLVGGVLMGWYVTMTHYRSKNSIREGIEAGIERYKFKRRPAPDSDYDRVSKALKELADIVDEYHIKWGGASFDFVEGPENISEK